MTGITLTRDEAAIIDLEMGWTGVEAYLERGMNTREDCLYVLRRVGLEMAIRDGGGEAWWASGDSPFNLASRVREGLGDCPDTFPMSGEGATALEEYLGEHLPRWFDWLDARPDAGGWEKGWKRPALERLAARFGVEIPAREAVS